MRFFEFVFLNWTKMKLNQPKIFDRHQKFNNHTPSSHNTFILCEQENDVTYVTQCYSGRGALAEVQY